MKALHYSVVMRGFSSCERKIVKNEAKLSIFETIFVPSYLLYLDGHENSAMIERVQLQVQAPNMRFLQKIKGFTSLTRCTTFKNPKSLEPLLQLKKSRLRWFGHVS